MLVMVNSTALHCTDDGRSVASTGDSHEAVGIIGELLSANLAGCGTDATGRLETCPAHKHWEKLGTSSALELSSSGTPADGLTRGIHRHNWTFGINALGENMHHSPTLAMMIRGTWESGVRSNSTPTPS
ncbi:hypothetical protein SUNI508_13050 [Seiridium unicorne]|uniref:Uncharacterized protein n=1 Tax=Seiridium unicorne TaxID=138068 RepID=A0ABR2VF26_9PEZI